MIRPLECVCFDCAQGYKIATGQVSREELRNVSDRYGEYRRCRVLGPLYDRTDSDCLTIPSYMYK